MVIGLYTYKVMTYAYRPTAAVYIGSQLHQSTGWRITNATDAYVE